MTCPSPGLASASWPAEEQALTSDKAVTAASAAKGFHRNMFTPIELVRHDYLISNGPLSRVLLVSLA
ncbi:hypothetical protein GCM10022221_62700 [Actinocorallia aurea]